MFNWGMLIESGYVAVSLTLLVSGAWLYSKRKGRRLRLLTFSFAFLAASILLEALNSIPWLPWIYETRPVLTLYEIAASALFTCFTIAVIVALREDVSGGRISSAD